MSNNADTNTRRRHFETFDALRFLAFFKVFLLHIPIVAFPWFNFIKAGGGIGVQFFFVLSGFLITYIISEEKKRKGFLDLKKFFVRRILRIWPLYYLMVIFAYSTPFILQNLLHLSSSTEGYQPQFWVSALFLENYKMMITHQHANVSPLSVMWSLCIEEHFYVIWGILLFYTAINKLPRIIVACIVVGIISRLFYYRYDIPTIDIISNVDLFAFGAIPAYFLIEHEHKLVKVVSAVPFGIKLFFVLILLVIVCVYSQAEGDRPFILGSSILGLLFSILLVFVLPGSKQLKVSDSNVLSRAGVYTYGLYLYHTIVINLFKQLFLKYDLSMNRVWVALAFFILALGLTLALSIFSYYLLEKQFLKLKKYFR